MGLVGIIDPTHDERKRDVSGRPPRWLPREELVAMFETAPPKFSPWTYEVVHAALDQWQDRDYISTTMLVGGCGRSKVIERREDFILDLDGMWPAFRGTQIHRTLEFSARPNSVAEGRFFTTLYIKGYGDLELSCSPDLITLDPCALVDYKAPVDDKSIPSYGYPWPNQVEQLQFNRYIVNHAERWELADGGELPWDPRSLVFKHLYIVYIGNKAPKVIEAQKPVNVPLKSDPTKTMVRKQPDIWHDDQVEDELVPRASAMLKALDAYPEWPEGLENEPGFAGPPGWACPGYPWCKLPACLAKRWPNGLVWENPKDKVRA